MQKYTTSNENIVNEQFNKPQIYAVKINNDQGHYLRLIRPLIANESCLACHANAKESNVLGVMDMYNDLKYVDDDLASSTRTYIIIFNVALIFTVFAVLYILKIVASNPVLDLLKHAKEL
nr:DUF3365 domain-containing protein [Campylobacter sp. RM16704]